MPAEVIAAAQALRARCGADAVLIASWRASEQSFFLARRPRAFWRAVTEYLLEAV